MAGSRVTAIFWLLRTPLITTKPRNRITPESEKGFHDITYRIGTYLCGWQLAGFGKRGPHGDPPGNHPGETVYARETPGISSSGPTDKIRGVSRDACADSGLESEL